MGQSVIKHGIYHNKSFWVQSISLFYLPFKMLKISSVKPHLLKVVWAHTWGRIVKLWLSNWIYHFLIT